MPFGLINKTGTFGLKLGSFTVDLVVGFTEEILFNFTSPANAIPMPDNIEVSDQVLTTTKKCAYGVGSVLAGSQVKLKIVELVTGATWNLIP